MSLYSELLDLAEVQLERSRTPTQASPARVSPWFDDLGAALATLGRAIGPRFDQQAQLLALLAASPPIPFGEHTNVPTAAHHIRAAARAVRAAAELLATSPHPDPLWAWERLARLIARAAQCGTELGLGQPNQLWQWVAAQAGHLPAVPPAAAVEQAITTPRSDGKPFPSVQVMRLLAKVGYQANARALPTDTPTQRAAAQAAATSWSQLHRGLYSVRVDTGVYLPSARVLTEALRALASPDLPADQVRETRRACEQATGWMSDGLNSWARSRHVWVVGANMAPELAKANPGLGLAKLTERTVRVGPGDFKLLHGLLAELSPPPTTPRAQPFEPLTVNLIEPARVAAR